MNNDTKKVGRPKRKDGQMIRVSCRIPLNVYAQLDAMARHDNTTISQFLRWLVASYVNRGKRD